MSAIATGSLFQGEDTRKVPIHSVMELEKGTFVCIGSMFAVSLLYGGPSDQVLVFWLHLLLTT